MNKSDLRGDVMAEESGLREPAGRPSWWLVGSIALGLLLILWPWLLKLPVPDESTFFYEGWQVAQGKVAYRDFFEFIGPGTLYWVALLIKLFGFSVLAIRLSMLVTLGLCFRLTWLLAEPFLNRRWRWLLMLFLMTVFIGSIQVQHHYYSAFTGLLAVWLLTESSRHHKNHYLWAAGVAVGLTGLITQSLGILLAGALALALVLQGWLGEGQSPVRAISRMLLHFVLPMLAPVGLTALYFASQGALKDLAYDTFGWLMSGSYAKTTSHWYVLDFFTHSYSYLDAFRRRPDFFFRHPDLLLSMLVSFLQSFLPVLGMLWGGEILFARWRKGSAGWQDPRQSAFLFLLAGAAAFFVANFSYPNTMLVAFHGWLHYILAFAALAELSRRHARLTSVTSGVLLTLAAGAVLNTGLESLRAYHTPGIISFGTRERTLSPVGNTRDGVLAVNALLGYLHDRMRPKDHDIFVYNGAPEMYMLTDQTNPTRYGILMALYNTPAQIEEAVSDLRRRQPRFIMYNQLDALDFKYDLRFIHARNYDYHMHPLEKLMDEAYQPMGQMGNLIIYERKGGTSPGE